MRRTEWTHPTDEDLQLCTRPPAGPPLIASAPPTVAVERLVFGFCHYTLWPLRLLSGMVSRERRRRGET